MSTPYRDALDSFRRQYLREALAANGWNRTKTATAIGMSRVHIMALIRELRIPMEPAPRNGGARVPARCGHCGETGHNAVRCGR
jgi:DNA-binding NtrC family response regulator